MNNIILYQTPQGEVRIDVRFEDETFWLTQKAMAELFQVDVRTINEHLQNIYTSEELERLATIRKNRIVQIEGKREVSREVDFYNLDAIIAVGYRVNSRQATQFRIWATKTLKEFIIKGFVLDDERLKQGKQFGKDYFDELLERIRDIRASEKRFYQKVRDLFTLSTDYKDNQKNTDLFFASTQNKLLYAATKHTAAEIIAKRADAEFPNMGLKTFKGSRVRKTDVIIAKNYLSEDEITTLNRMVTFFLDAAEMRVEEKIPLSLDFWKEETDNIIKFSRKALLTGSGTISQKRAQEIAEKQYSIFDAQRKKLEAEKEDKEDEKSIQELVKKIRKKQ